MTPHFWRCASCQTVIAGGAEPPGHFCRGPRTKRFPDRWWAYAREQVADLAGSPLESEERLERLRRDAEGGDAA